MSPMLRGAESLSRGWTLVREPGLRPFVWVPLGINVVLFGLITFWSVQQISAWVLGLDLAPDLPAWLDILEPWVAAAGTAFKGLLVVAGTVLVLLVAGSVATVVTQVLAAPFLGILAERVEARVRGVVPRQEPIWPMLVRSLRREIHKLVYWAVRALALSVLSLVLLFIPALNLLGTLLWYLFGAWMMAAQYLDIPADNAGIGFTEVLARMRAHRTETLGFGAAVMLVSSLPLVNLCIVPVAVAGGVCLWVRLATDGAGRP